MENLLKPDPRTAFEIFANEMYQENCIERESYGEPILTLDEYIEKNIEFLLDNSPKSVL
jgi:hypothetical protein